MTSLRRVAIIGNSLPRRCGIATFTTDLQQAIAASDTSVQVSIAAITDDGRSYDYPPTVWLQIGEDAIEDYERAADVLNASAVDVVSLQHEFGIFGGEAGGHVITLLSRLTMPVVTTLHTVLEEPSPAQREILDRIVGLSTTVVVMAEKGRQLLRSVYDVPAEKIEVIPHGIPNVAFVAPDHAKAQLGYSDRAVILTFGLLSPNKGIEVMIDAMPQILQSRPDAIYVVLGATHPHLVRQEGEAYRGSLMARVRANGVEDHVVFLDQFVDQATLLDFIAMCDVYVTPYLNQAQMTSGTLAYSFGLGKAVVSTPYWHAEELLGDGRGVLVPFSDAAALGGEIALLLTDDKRRNDLRRKAYAVGRSMTWARTAERYLTVLAAARQELTPQTVVRLDIAAAAGSIPNPPEMQLGHFLSMCDDTGLFQHAVHSVPDRSHGYCVDDNSRALLVACALNGQGEQCLPEARIASFAAFIQHAWNPDARRFRNFMGFDRRWLEDRGSEDSHGRTLWALGECSRSDATPARRRWATALFAQALPTVETFHSPRAWAFTLLGLAAYCDQVDDTRRLRKLLADRLMSIMSAVETPDWVWFENGLAYDNARLPQALIVTGRSMGSPTYVAAGLRALRWLMAQQTAPQGHFRPVGSETFGDQRAAPKAFDQQPLEAAATISACLAAWRADGDIEWRADAARAFHWFLGDNDLKQALVDVDTGCCRDGLHSDRPNQNCGGESVVSYLLGLAEIRQLSLRTGSRMKPAPLQAVGT